MTPLRPHLIAALQRRGKSERPPQSSGRAVRLLVSLGKPPVVLLTGGLANDAGLLAAMREAAAAQKLGVDIRRHEQSMLAGAIGAALWGAFRARKLQQMKLGDRRAS